MKKIHTESADITNQVTKATYLGKFSNGEVYVACPHCGEYIDKDYVKRVRSIILKGNSRRNK